jgi:hypothetical protein
VVADAAFGRAARDVVCHPVALEDLDRLVVHVDRDRDDDRLLAPLEDADQVRIDLKEVGDEAQLFLRELEGVLPEVADRRGDGRHRRAQYTTVYAATESRRRRFAC